MILNGKNNNFIINLTKGFIYTEIEDKYSVYISKLPTPYTTVLSYLSASIQSITFPALSAESVEQVLYEDPVKWKGGKRLDRYLNKEFTIGFKNYEGYTNYWILYEQFQAYYALDNREQFFPDVTITFLDHTGYEFVRVILKQIVMNSLSEIDLNYSSNSAEFKNFTAGFSFNYIEIINNILK